MGRQVVKKAVIMCMQMRNIEVSPARYQLIHEMSKRKIEVFLCLRGKLSREAIKSCRGIHHCLNVELMNKRKIREEIVKYKPNIVIAFTCEDAEVLWPLPNYLKYTKFYYYNLEINTPDYYLQAYKKNTWNYWIKKVEYPISVLREAFYTKQCEFLVIQDEERKRIASKYYISHKKTMMIPNSYIYDEKERCSARRKELIYSGGVREKYLADYWNGFYQVKKVPIVFSGTFDEWSRAELVRLHRINPNIRMEQQTLDAEAYTKYLQEYSIGLVCYSKGSDDNLNYIGLSSGKFFKHLSLGQPVIILGHSQLSREVQKYGLGIAIEEASEIERAYNEIMDNYVSYSENVVSTYQLRYDFGKVIRPFLTSLEA